MIKIDNKSIFTDNQVRKMVNFAMHPYVKIALEKAKLKINIVVRTGDCATGSISGMGRNEIMIYLQVADKTWKYPHHEKVGQKDISAGGTQDYIPTLVLSREEHLVHCAAHELFHIAQYIYHKIAPHETNFEDEVWSDKYADKYAIKIQRQWRKLNNTPVYPL